MAEVDLAEFLQLKQERRPVLGLDLGDKTIGLALSDNTWCIASPLLTIKRTTFKKDVLRLREVLELHNVCGVVLGLPLNMNGTAGPRVQMTRQFAQNFLRMVDIPLCFWDERLSTKGVSYALEEAGLSFKKKKAVVDKLAASFILQGVLNS